MTRRVALASCAVVCLVTLLLGGAAYLRFARDLRVQNDQQLASLAERPRVLLTRPGPDTLAQLRTAAGVVRSATPALQLLGTIPPKPPGYANATVGGVPLRVLTRSFAGGARFSVALDRTATQRTLTRVRRDLLIGAIVAALLSAAALAWITRRVLAPVHDVATLAERVARTNDLRDRVPQAAGDDELARLTSSINRMLDRLESSDAALRRLVGDASHELRNPITSLRGNLELLMSGTPISDEDRAAALSDAYAQTRDLEQLVEDLLELARADAVPKLEPISVSALVEGLPSERVSVAADVTGAVIAGDERSLQAMVRNLIENAERYAGAWTLTLTRVGSAMELRVVDHGPGIPASERPSVFARFARGSAGRETPGSGIGLAIVEAVARSHGGDVAIENTPGGGATFIVRLPLSSPSIYSTPPASSA
jgi:two-component system, OmpR family, sensor histidine kinase MprB